MDKKKHQPPDEAHRKINQGDSHDASHIHEWQQKNKELEKKLAEKTAALDLMLREAQIEAALERIRAKTMAMQTSDELGATSLLLFNELKALGEISEQISIGIFDEENQVLNLHATLHGKQWEESSKIDLDEPHAMRKIYSGWQQKKNSIQIDLNGEELKAYNRFRSKYSNLIFPDERWVIHCAFFSKGVFSFSTTVPHDEQTMRLLERFAQVFDGTYTRFLDLQKAEAQVREAQIETALERVRAASMAMHQSEELLKVITIIFNQLKTLGVEFFQAWMAIYFPDEGYLDIWLSPIDDLQKEAYYIKMPAAPFEATTLKDWKAGKEFSYLSINGKEQVGQFIVGMDELIGTDFYSKMFEKLPLENIETTDANHKYGSITIGKQVKATEAEKAILKRFAKVFEQTYTRFLDLQKAETQAREAEVEAALERVRSATMAMHKSTELHTAASVLFNQLKLLGADLFTCGFVLCESDNPVDEQWLHVPDVGTFVPQYIPHEEERVHFNLYKAWQSGTPFYSETVEGQELEDIFQFLMAQPSVQKNISQFTSEGVEFPKFQKLHGATFSKGYLLIITTSHFPEEQMFTRFAKVFEQTYTRFLDLQKAEAQAREAQIEAALERVRAASMAMHKSEDLPKVALTFLKQIEELDIPILGTSVNLVNEAKASYRIYFANGHNIGITDELNTADFWLAKESFRLLQNGETEFTLECEGAKLKSWIDWLKKEIHLGRGQRLEKANLKKAFVHTVQFHELSHLIFSSIHPLTEETLRVMRRITKAFGQSYVRYLDLQKAEAQAREAKIEATLERVRARAMAMRRSDELSEAAELLYHEFFKLGVESFSCGYLINDDEKAEWKIWLTNPGEKFFKEFWTASYEADHNLKSRYDSWKRQEEFHCAVLEGEENRAHHIVVSQYAPWKADMAGSLPSRLVFNSAHFSLGHLLVISPDRLTTELEQAMVRFASVFDLAYRRFLDLQKTEEQARQLEKVFNENQRLLHSILPEPIAEQIRTGRQNVVKRFEQVSILFADIVGFTVMSEKFTPQKVVDILNGLFSKFDDLTDEYHLEKIKTIGDAYMVAAGVPEEKEKHALALFHFAQTILSATEAYNQTNGLQLQLRIGISSGPVVAGVIGKKKFAYDLWGDTVNTAARMEAYGQAGKIQVSPTSHELLKNDFAFEKISDVLIKGKGLMDVYLWRP